jgi:hypothetical protein
MSSLTTSHSREQIAAFRSKLLEMENALEQCDANFTRTSNNAQAVTCIHDTITSIITTTNEMVPHIVQEMQHIRDQHQAWASVPATPNTNGVRRYHAAIEAEEARQLQFDEEARRMKEGGWPVNDSDGNMKGGKMRTKAKKAKKTRKNKRSL